MSTDVATMIAANEARGKCANEPDLLERLRKAMRACHGHWMQTNENEQIRAALAAAIMESDEADKQLIVESSQALSRANATLRALLAGVPVDIDRVPMQPDGLLPIMQLWQETRP